MKTKSTSLARKAPAAPSLLQGSPGGDQVSMIRACQCPPMAAISAQQAGHRVDAGSIGISLIFFANFNWYFELKSK